MTTGLTLPEAVRDQEWDTSLYHSSVPVPLFELSCSSQPSNYNFDESSASAPRVRLSIETSARGDAMTPSLHQLVRRGGVKAHYLASCGLRHAGLRLVRLESQPSRVVIITPSTSPRLFSYIEKKIRKRKCK